MFVAGFMGSPSMNFIPAELTRGRRSPAVAFTLADGKTASAAARRRRVADRHAGEQRRPRHPAGAHLPLRPRPSRASPASPRSTAPVEVVEPTGAETMAVLRFGEQEVVGRFDPDDAPRMGETMTLAIDMTRACLFDPTTQRLI